MRPAEVSLRRAQEKDTPEVLSLLRSTLGEGAIGKTSAFWSWKHERNPFGPSPILVAESKDRIIGVRVFMRWRWRSGRKVLEAVRAVDTATDKEWQGKGIFTKLTLQLVDEIRKEPVAFIFNTPNRRSGPGYIKMGWSSVGSVTLYVRPSRPLRLLGEYFKKQLHDVPTRPASDRGDNEGHRATRVLHERDTAGLLQGLLEDEDPRLSTDRSMKFLLWRYADIPDLAYSVATAEKNNVGAGLVFRMVYRGALRELRLCELLASRVAGSVRILRELIQETIHDARPDYAASMAASGTIAQRALLAAGFVPIPRLGPLLTVRPLDMTRESPNPLFRSSWRLSIGDLEIF